ncbi:MAG: c-type cytochrome [Verrucomicrobia bacterium]|nr:c-type cytochrome [Verrucomicrobiota bacterium]
MRPIARCFCLLTFVCLFALFRAVAAEPGFELKDGDRVVFLGDALIETEQRHGWIETMLTSRFPDRNVTFRNLGWSGDTPAGVSRVGLSLLQAGYEPADEGWNQLLKQIEEAKPTVVFLGYGMASSLETAAERAKFRADYLKLLNALAAKAPGARVVVLSPIRHEALGAPWPEATAHNAELEKLTRTLDGLAAERGHAFVSLFEALRPAMESPRGPRLTSNGIHLNPIGARLAAQAVEEKLFGAGGAWRGHPQAGPLRDAIVRKNEWFFHRSRPENMAYIFGFRKREQGKNATEIPAFDTLIAEEEVRIAKLRSLAPGNVPEIPRRTGNLTAVHTPQPHPQFEVADGLEVTLWAENPLLHKPIQMNFDTRGRLWIASSEVYPQIVPGQQATDKVIVLEDSTGSGRADKATVFADGLLIPTGIEPGDGGVYVAQSTELLHFSDTDGDGKADTRRVVLSGFGTEDTHHNLHTLRWGVDGRLYLNQSVYTRTHAETPHGMVRLGAGGVFRFDPRDQKMEILFRGWVNTWGHQFDDFGQEFLTDGAGFDGVSWGVSGATFRTLAPKRREHPSVSPGSYPKFCGLEIVRSALFPADWQGDIVTNDFRAHRVVRFKVRDQGAGYVTQEMPDVMRTTTATFRPLDIKLGPDGALYLADWSNPIIQHGEVDFRDPRRDKEHGRIWRIAPKGSKPLPRVDFSARTNPELLDALVSPNRYDEERARRVLVERGAAKVLPDLAAWTRRQTTEPAKLRALWLHQSFNQIPTALLDELLAAKDARARAAAVRAMPVDRELARLPKLVADEHPRVRHAAVRALGQVANVRAADLALSALARPMDPFLEHALWLTMNDLAGPWLAAVKSGTWKTAGRERELEFTLRALEPTQAAEVLGLILERNPLPRDGSGPWIELTGAAGGPKELRALFAATVRSEFAPPVAQRALAALADATRLRSARPDGDLGALGGLLDATEAATRTAAIRLAGAWKLAGLNARLLRVAAGADASAGERTAAFEALRELGGQSVIAELARLAREHPAAPVRREAAVALTSLNLARGITEAISVLKSLTDEAEATTLWRGLLAIRGAGARLAAEVPKASLPPLAARAGLRPAREGGQNDALVAALMKSAGLVLSELKLSAAEMQALAQQALAKGDAARGERLYRRAELACVACHAIGGAGGKVGPDLTSIGASAPTDYLVESLLYPNAKVKEGFHSVVLSTKDGRDLSGMIVSETASLITLRDATNQEISVPAANVARRTSVGSLMPAGLVDNLLPDERLDLVKFLAQLGKPGDYDAAKGGVARSWKIYVVSTRNEPLGKDGVARGDFALADWVPLLSFANGALPKDPLEPYLPRTNSRGTYLATQFDATGAGRANFAITGEVVGAWLNGAPVRAGAQFAADVKPGRNTLVLRIDSPRGPDAIKLESRDVTWVTGELK